MEYVQAGWESSESCRLDFRGDKVVRERIYVMDG
jgi:hypothetical protein